MSSFARCGLVVLALLFAVSAQAETLRGRYFMVVWGYQSEANAPEDAHTFASFYRGNDLARGVNNPLTISWLPATRVVRSLGQERGRNFSLGETLQIARTRGYRVQAYGPYEIKPDLYRRAQAQVRSLRSGRILYTMINGPDDAMNCIKAVGDIGGPINTGFAYGFAASRSVVDHLTAWTVEGSAATRQAAAIIDVGRYAAGRPDRAGRQARAQGADPIEFGQ